MPTPNNPIAHLWIVVTDINSTGKCAIVNVTTLSHLCDKTVILHAGDHPSIDHDSVIRYQDALITTENAVENAIRGGVANRKRSLSPAILNRVVAGIGASKDTSLDVKVFCGFSVKTKIPIPSKK
jgi:hypothetical protein